MKLVSLISGGIDSPVATYLMLKKGHEIIALHMDNRPFTDLRHVEKAKNLVRHIGKLFNSELKGYIVPHGMNQNIIAKNCKRCMMCVLCRRLMFRVATNIALRENADAILTGESLGQVSSQTPQNILVESSATELPIIRPLIGFDKVEIINIAKKIMSYEISILPSICCTIAPNKPSRSVNLSSILKEEEKLNLSEMVEIV